MGKRLIQQARGKGGPTYRSPGFRYRGEVKHKARSDATVTGVIQDFVNCAGHSAPLASVKYADGEETLILAAEGLRLGEEIVIGEEAPAKVGNTLTLNQIPIGTLIFNVESQPGDGGKFCRTGGSFAKVVDVRENKVYVELPSKKQRAFHTSCRATIGVLAGAGRTEKPLMKAGRAYYKHRAKNKLYPKIAGTAQNSVDHPFGKSSSHTKGRPLTTPKNAPPGRKVGQLRAKQTGRKKR